MIHIFAGKDEQPEVKLGERETLNEAEQVLYQHRHDDFDWMELREDDGTVIVRT